MDEVVWNVYDTKPVYEILEKIKSGQKLALSKETLLLCVEALLLEGYQTSAIANLLKKSDRTIRRYIFEVRENNALDSCPDITRVLVGEFVTNARSQYSRLKQLARSKEVSAVNKAKTEFLAWRVYKELIDMLYYVGFLFVDPLADSEESDAKMQAKILREMKQNEMRNKLMTPEERDKMLDGYWRQIMKKQKKLYRKKPEQGG